MGWDEGRGQDNSLGLAVGHAMGTLRHMATFRAGCAGMLACVTHEHETAGDETLATVRGHTRGREVVASCG